jgi:hypothetical protein
MTKSVTLHDDMYNILINNKYNNFTIQEFRDELLKKSNFFNEKNLARKFIYRQVNRLVNRGLLVKIKESGDKKARFVKSELFCVTTFKNKGEQAIPNTDLITDTIASAKSSVAVLENEKTELQDKLDAALSEVDTYDMLIERFPEELLKITNLKYQAKKNSSSLIGKLNAVSNMLSQQ